MCVTLIKIKILGLGLLKSSRDIESQLCHENIMHVIINSINQPFEEECV